MKDGKKLLLETKKKGKRKEGRRKKKEGRRKKKYTGQSISELLNAIHKKKK